MASITVYPGLGGSVKKHLLFNIHTRPSYKVIWSCTACIHLFLMVPTVLRVNSYLYIPVGIQLAKKDLRKSQQHITKELWYVVLEWCLPIMYLLSCLHICMVYIHLYHHVGPAYYTFISPILLCRSALKILSFMLKNKNCCQTIMLFIYKFV